MKCTKGSFCVIDEKDVVKSKKEDKKKVFKVGDKIKFTWVDEINPKAKPKQYTGEIKLMSRKLLLLLIIFFIQYLICYFLIFSSNSQCRVFAEKNKNHV